MRINTNRKHVENWLRRTRRELMVSGRLTEIAILLDRVTPIASTSWQVRLQGLLTGDWIPDSDEIILLDRMISLAATGKKLSSEGDSSQQLLF